MATEETIITEPTAVEQTQPQQEIETIDVAQTAETEMPKIEAAAIEETTPLPVIEETTVPVAETTAIETTTTLGDDDKKIKQSNLNKFYAKVKENPNYSPEQAKIDFKDVKWDDATFDAYAKYANTRIANKYSLDVLNQKFNEKSGYTIDADIDVNTIPELGKQTPREDLVAISGASGLQLNYSGAATAEPTKAAEPKAVEEAKPKEIKLGADQAFGPGKAQQVQYELAKKRVEGKEKTFPQGWSIAKGKELKVDANPNNEAGIFGGYDLWNVPKDDVTRLRYYSDKMNQVVEGENVKKSKERAFKAAFGTSFSAGLTDLGLSTGVIDINDLVFTKQNEKDLQNRRNLQNKALKDAAPVIEELADAMTHGNTYYRYFNLEKDESGNTVDYTLNVPKVADAVQRQVYQLLGDGNHSLLEKAIEEAVLKTLVYKAEESESREYFEKIELPKLKKQFPEMFSQTEMAAQFVEGTTDEEIIKKAQAQVEIVAANQEKLRDKEFAPIKQEYEATAEPLRQSYEIALAKYNEDVKAIQLMVDSGNKTPEQAQAELNILNENIKNQQVVVETELKGLYDKLQYDYNRINTKYNNIIDQAIQRQEKTISQSINKELAAFAKKRASNPEFVKAFTEAKKRSFTLNEFAMKRGLKRDKDERTRTILDNFLLSAQKAFGTTLETYGNMWGADWLRIYGKGLEASTIITPAKVDSWTDAINPFNAAKLGGQLVGVMGPSITAGVATSYLTGGTGSAGAAQAVVSDVVGAVVSWGVNNFEMSQRSFDTKFKETGNVALATDAYNSMMSFQTNELIYHMADVLPFGKFAKIIKSPILRGITIGGVSYAGELTQEYREGLAEKAINAGMDPYQLIGEQTTGLGNYIKDRMGVDKFQTQGEKEAATASYNYFKETAIATSPLFFGSAGGQYISAKSEAYKRSEASQKGLELFQKYIVDQNSDYKGLRQTLSTITMEKGSAFATMIAESMYAAGHIESKSDRDAIVNTIKAADELIKSPSVQKMDRTDRGIYTLLADNYQNTVISLENETDPIQKEALQKRVDDLKKEMSAFATTKKSDVMQLTLNNGQTIFFTPNEMVDFVGKNPEFGYFLSTGLATISPIKGDFTANQKSTLEAINQKIDEYEAKQSPVAPKKQVAATEETAKIKFATFEDAKEYIAERIAEYDSEQAFYDSDEYAQLYPEIKKIYDSEQEFRTVATPDDAVALLESKGYNVGDKVEAVTINEMGAPMVLTGTVAILNGRPVINLDENQSTLSGDVVLRINDNWKVTESAKAKPTEEVAPATTEAAPTVTETTKPTEYAVQEQAAGKVPVQPEAGVSETMAEGKPEAEPQVAAEEGQAEQAQAPTEEKKIDESIVEYSPSEDIKEKDMSIITDVLGKYKITPPAEPEITDFGDVVTFEYYDQESISPIVTRITLKRGTDGLLKSKGSKIERNTSPIRRTEYFKKYISDRTAQATKVQTKPTTTRPLDNEMEVGNTELNSAKVGETIITTQPSRIYKGTFGKRNPNGSIRSAHPDVKGSFGSTDRNIALKYKGNESFKAFDIPAGTTIEVVKTPKFGEGISIARQDETDRINNSTAQIVRLDTIDNGGRQSQFIIKDRALIDNGYLVEEQVSETAQAQVETKTEELLTADTKDKTNLQKVFDFLDKLDSDLDKFGRETTGMNLPIPVIKAIIKTAKALVATGITLQEAIRRAAAENNVSEQDAIDAINSFAEQPPITPPPSGAEPENGTNEKVRSVYERMALKAESEGNLELAAQIRDKGLYEQRPKEQVEAESNLLISSFNDDIEAAADFVMNNTINGDIRTNVLGKRMTRAKEAALSNRTVENLATLEQAIYDFAAYSTDLGQAVNEIKNVEANNPELFYLGRFSEYIATLADNLGNPAVTTTNASKIVKAAKDVVKLRKDILNKVANVISEMADDATIDSLMIDALELDKAGKNRVLTNKMRNGLRKIVGSVESKKIIGEKLKRLAELGVFGLEETRDEVKELIRRGLAEVNPTLQTPLDTNEIKEMAEMFMIIYEEMATQKMEGLLDKAFNGNNKNNAAVIKAVMYGALDTPNALNKFAQKFGLSYISPQMQQQLKNAAQQVVNARGNAARSVAQAAFTSMFNNFIYQTKPTGYKILNSIRSFFSYFENIFYNTALFAINTFDRASQGNILRTFGNVLNAVARGDFMIIADSFKDVYRKKDVSFNYTDRNGNVQSIDAKTRLVFDDVYSSLRGLPRLAEVKRAGGLNEVEIDIRNTDSRLKRRLLRTFAVPASRIMGAVDATVMPLNMFLTKRQAFYDVLKAFYKDKGIAISEAQLRTQLNDILGVDTDYISKAMEQAVVDVMGSKLWTDLGFTNTDEFPLTDPRLTTGKGSRESKIYNEFLFRTREILDSEENKRLQDSFSKMGYGGLMTPTESDLMSAAIDNYAIRVSSELAFLGTPRGSLRVPAEAISKLSNKFLPLKYAGLAPLFTNAAFNSAGMAIRVTPGLNIIQYLKYLYTGTRGGYSKESMKEFGSDYEALTKIDQNKMLRTVLLTNAAFVIAAALKPYDDNEEEKKAIDNKTWTGSTPLKLTKAQTDLGYLPGRIYINGKDYDYRDNPLALLISSISFIRNYGLWSFDPRSTNFYAEDDGEIGYDPDFIDQASSYGLFITASMLELSTIKDMSKTYSDLIEILSPPTGEDDVKQSQLLTRFLEKKGANIIRTSIPYTRFVAEMKTIKDAITNEDKKLPITFYDNIVFGHAIEDNVIKTNGYDFFGRPVKDAFTLISPLVSSVSINQDPKVDREHSLYRKMNYTPRLLLNDRLPVHITLDDLNGDANKFEDFFKKVKAEEKKEGGLIEEVERKSMTEQRVLVSLAMSKEEANLANQKACEFAGKFVEENFINLQDMDMSRFKDAMNSIYNIGREVAIYQNLGNLIEYDKADYYSMINNKIKKFKDTYVGSTMDNLSWPQEFEPSSILGDSFETQPKVIL